MPDISLCHDTACPSRQSCRRFIAKPSQKFQSWLPQLREKGWDRCGYFMPAHGEPVRSLDEVRT